VVGFAGEQGASFLFADVGFGRGQLAVEIFEEILALVGVGFFCG
jgi:hypothetical protein